MRFGLRLKIVSLITLIILLVMSAVAILVGLREEETLRSEMRLRATKIAQIIGSMSLVNLKGAGGISWDLSQNFIPLVPKLDENLLYIAIVDKEGSLQASSVNTVLLTTLLGTQDVEEEKTRLIEEVRERIVAARTTREGDLGAVAGPFFPVLSKAGRLLPVEVDLKPRQVYEGTVAVGWSLAAMERKVRQAWLVGLGLTGGFILLGILISLPLVTGITRPITLLVKGMEKVKAGDLSTQVVIHRADEIGMLAQAFNFMTRGLHEREIIKETFKRYVSGEVVDTILKGGARVILTGEKRRASVLFSDIRDFTALTEKIPPEEAVGLLNDYFSVMVNIIFSHQGTLDKFMGDAIMAVFGAPVALPDHSLKAVKAGIEMQMALLRWDEVRLTKNQAPLLMGIGIATGEVVSGNIGTSKRMDYTVIGDVVNLAARLSGQAKGGQIFISQETQEEIKEKVKTKQLAPLQIKGKSQPATVYEILY